MTEPYTVVALSPLQIPIVEPEDALDPSALSRIYGLPLRRSWVDTPRGWIIHPG